MVPKILQALRLLRWVRLDHGPCDTLWSFYTQNRTQEVQKPTFQRRVHSIIILKICCINENDAQKASKLRGNTSGRQRTGLPQNSSVCSIPSQYGTWKSKRLVKADCLNKSGHGLDLLNELRFRKSPQSRAHLHCYILYRCKLYVKNSRGIRCHRFQILNRHGMTITKGLCTGSPTVHWYRRCQRKPKWPAIVVW